MRRASVLIASLALVLSALPVGAAVPDAAIDRIEELRLPNPITRGPVAHVDEALAGAEGPVQISVRMAEPSLSRGGNGSTIDAQQAEVVNRIEALGGTVHGSVDTVLNAVFATVDADKVAEIAEVSSVTTIRPVADYVMELSETVPYIGGTDVHDAGFDGTGTTVAVLDSGVDYYHAALGGSGDPNDYANDDPTTREPGTFPTAKVVEGFDFVGDEWPNGDLAPDPDPLDSGPGAFHGTHVADIIAGNLGVAPGASLVAVKVCSSQTSSCSGIALIQGMEFAVEAGVDIINMSLGSLYGQPFDDDLAAAVDGATAAGVLTVAAAGNTSDKPYTTDSPGSAPTALSVAQTQVPSALLVEMEVIEPAESAGFYEAVHQGWSAPLTAQIAGPVLYGDGAGGNLDGCEEFAPGSVEGQIVAVDRGTCNFSLKIQNIEAGGGILGIIMLVDTGAPFEGAFGGGELPGIPAYMIHQSTGDILRTGNAVISFDPATGIPLVGSLVGTSGRGPSNQFNNMIKPEIGAPGASVSAEVGTGTQTTPFGGTSGATPMVAGSAALLMQAEPGLTPLEVKARLVNTADPDIETAPGAGLAPITRIGGGEVRVNRAFESDAAAWDAETMSPALSFGFVEATADMTLEKTVTVRNYGGSPITYDVDSSFRYANDEANGAVSVSVSPSQVTVPAGGTAEVVVTLTIDAELLRDWDDDANGGLNAGNSGFNGANPAWLNLLEYDGYVTLDAEGDVNDIHLPWHVLPRDAADVDVERDKKNVTFTNAGVNDAELEVYHLIATSDDLPQGGRGENNPVPDFRAAGVAFYTGSETGCASELLVAFAVNTWERQTHANAPATFEFDIDIDNDGEADYAVLNADLSFLSTFNLSDGRNVVFAIDLETNAVTAFFFTDHETNSGNTVLLVCGEQIGLDSQSVKQKKAGVGLAVDIYFQGVVTDLVPFDLGAGNQHPPLRIGNQPVQFISLEPGESVTARLFAISQTQGALVLVRGGAPGDEEAIIIEK
ncbi:MAG TPA: S8 family serine peptidase [Acidimicrobiia bacterium]